MRLALILTILLAAGAVRAQQSCQQVSGTVTTTFSTQGCTSPFGLCTTGAVDAGALSGPSTFTVTSIVQRGPVMFFSGVFTVGGTAFDTTGALNTVTGMYVETFQPVNGGGSLVSTGTATGTGFTGTLQGAVCS